MLKTYLDFKLIGYFHFIPVILLPNPLGYFSKYTYSNMSSETVMQLRETEKGGERRNCDIKQVFCV